MPVRSYLYDAEGRDHEVELSAELLRSLEGRQLLWIDIDERDNGQIEAVAGQLELDPDVLCSLVRPQPPLLENYGTYMYFSVDTAPATVADDDDDPATPNRHRQHGTRLDFIVARNWLLTIHDGDLNFINLFRAHDRPETTIGALTTHDFTASLLDAHLEAFFEEIARIEALIDRLDEQALTRPSSKSLLGRMVSLRRRVSRLRVRLSSQRGVFYALSRPDLQTVTEAGASPHFQVLAGRFERAIDEVEHARDLIVGSFELFATRTAQQTNDLVKVLTYLTAVIGVCAAVAGVFGMNFDTDFFTLGDAGFYTTIITLILIVLLATIAARWRRWI